MTGSPSLCTYKKLLVSKKLFLLEFYIEFRYQNDAKCCLSLGETGSCDCSAGSSKIQSTFYRVPENGSHIAHGACIGQKFGALRYSFMKFG